MTQVLELDDEDVEVLRFILDSTVEEWECNEQNNIRNISEDRTIKNAETMLECVGDIKEMNRRVRAIRDRL
jgi:polyhydroxyalkanoate synthesis regulator phasin